MTVCYFLTLNREQLALFEKRELFQRKLNLIIKNDRPFNIPFKRNLKDRPQCNANFSLSVIERSVRVTARKILIAHIMGR